MYHNQSMDSRSQNSNQGRECEYNDAVLANKFVVNWSPPENCRYIANRRFGSPRALSKSVPRRNKSVLHYRTNRSLNFDIGAVPSESPFKSPHSTSDSSFEGVNQLSRSAKIMKALNFNCSPNYGKTKKIKKSLNFDTSPSPKKFYNRGAKKTLSNSNLRTPISKLNRTLNFDSSPSDSSIGSVLATSNESMDENQNRTPSQRSNKILKSLNYLSPSLKINPKSPNCIINSPFLRTSLKERINNIVQNEATPNIHHTKRIKTQSQSLNVSTARNLFSDFEENDDNGNDNNNGRPSTPENMFRIIPQSTSAIKKSHKKERLSGRINHSSPIRIQTNSERKIYYLQQTDKLSLNEKRFTAPEVGGLCSTPYNVKSIKKSHKKEKSVRKVPQSEEELSESGSLFDYSEYRENSSPKNVPFDSKSDNNTSKTSDDGVLSEDERNERIRAFVRSSAAYVEEYKKELNQGGAPLNENENQHNNSSVISNHSENDNEQITPEKQDPVKPSTPKNHINYLQKVMTVSIKKSHKKIKDEKKKKFFKVKTLDLQDEEVKSTNEIDSSINEQLEENVNVSKDNSVSSNEDRAITPERINSSRLLISQYNSVKKSHKKEKRTKMMSKFLTRQKNLNHSATDSLNETKASNDSSSSLNLSSMNSHNSSLPQSHEQSCQKENISESCYTTPPDKLSPNKRKIFETPVLGASINSTENKSLSIDYETAEDEFKIFTPIKRRKPFMSTTKEDQPSTSCTVPSINIDTSRCVTPVSDLYKSSTSTHCAFLTPRKNDNIEISNHQNCSSESNEQISTSPDNPNGSSTPKNMSTAELLPNFNSIKISHKKDKRGSCLSKSVTCDQRDSLRTDVGKNKSLNTEINFQCLNSHDSSFENDIAQLDVESDGDINSEEFKVIHYDDEPQPSTSKENIGSSQITEAAGNNEGSLDETPPNSLKVRNIIKLMQTTSIKRSHKKIRDSKKRQIICEDPSLSDDGSIFDEQDRMEMENLTTTSNINDSNETDTQNVRDVKIVDNNSGSKDANHSSTVRNHDEITPFEDDDFNEYPVNRTNELPQRSELDEPSER